MNAEAQPQLFDLAAQRVRRWLWFGAWLRLLGRTAVPVFATALIGWVALRRAGWRDEAGWGLLLAGAWLAGCALIAWLRRADSFATLATWDRAAGRREMFASAWFFEKSGAEGVGARVHLARARDALRESGPFLRRDLPVRHQFRTWLAPLLFLAFAFSGWLRLPRAEEDTGLAADARLRAGEVGKTLAERADLVEPLKSLTDEEREKLKGLRVELKQTAQQLQKMETPRDVLEGLERGARDTEKLAEALQGDDLGALSPSFLAELERNADTADLGNAARAQDLGRAAEEARLLSARLGQKKPTLEEQKRLEEALKRSLGAANKKDRESKLGRHLAEAERQLGAGNHQGAAGQFGELAQHLGRSAQRQQAQKQLRGLAQSFRGAGQQILGGKNLQRLLPQAPAGSQPLATMPLPSPGAGNLGQQPLGAMPLPAPGQGAPLAQIPIPGSPGAAPRGGIPFPVPGAGMGGKPGTAPIPGMGQTPGGAPAGGMAFPIPGAPMAGLGTVPGAGGDAATGGSQAGHGTASLGNNSTKPNAATDTGTVAPAPGADGPSEVRAVAGASHREQAARSRQEIASDFLKAEEAALADEPLPLSRREQVLRYFTALRQQLEQQP